MSTTSGNPIAAAVGENQFAPEAQYGQVEQQAQLTQEAPISGAPTPGPVSQPAPAPNPVAPAGQVSAPAPAPTILPAYHAQLAETWNALASMPGVSPRVKALAKQAKADAKRHG